MADISIIFKGAVDQAEGPDGPFYLTNGPGWSAVCAWARSPAAKRFARLRELAARGSIKGTSMLGVELAAACVVASRPARGVLEELAERVGVGDAEESLIVTDGENEDESEGGDLSGRGGLEQVLYEMRLLESVLHLYEGWITLTSKDKEGDKHGSTHVYIGAGGKIEKGPKHMHGKTVGELKDTHRVTAVHGAKHPETGDKEGPKEPEKSTEKPASPIDNTSPIGDNASGGGEKPKPEEPKMTNQELADKVAEYETARNNMVTPRPETMRAILSHYGISEDDAAGDTAGMVRVEKISQVIDKLQERHPIRLEKAVRGEPDPKIKAALKTHLDAVLGDPATDALPIRYETASKKGGTLSDRKVTFGEIKAWRHTPGREHVTQDDLATYDPERDTTHVQHLVKGDIIPGKGVVTDFRRIGNENEYLVRPFTKSESKADAERRRLRHNQKLFQD